MNPAAIARLSTLFDEVADLPAPALEARLAVLASEEAVLLPALRRMLAARAAPETDDALARGPAFAAPPEPAAFAEGEAVGPYRLLRRLGEGGMGEVWLAERRDGQLKRGVALKLPVLSLRRSVLVQRFARERDILASLQHPNIARLYDAGLADDGQPFLALEYVEGLTITEHCNARGLGVRERIGLLLQVLDAVQYAHGRLVIHRDLKPGNVLVRADGQAMLLDFGIAKLAEGEQGMAVDSELTRQGGRALTPAYAAPEQLAGAAHGTASDIYSLGVLLYELVAGQRPFAGGREGDAEPARPRGVPADLATIAAKALKREPGARYATVHEMGADLRRWLAGEPVLAQPDRAAYRLRKFVGRHRAAVAAAFGVALTVLLAAGLALRQAALARHEADRAQAVQAFVLDLFRTNSAEQVDPERARRTTARELLDRGAARLARTPATEPSARIALAETIGALYVELELWQQAAQLTGERLALARRLYGRHDARLVAALLDHARALEGRENAPEGEIEALLAEAQAALDAAGDTTSARRATLYVRQAEHALSLDPRRAIEQAESAAAIFRQHHPEDPGRVDALNMLASALNREGDTARAVACADEALDLVRRQPAPGLRLVFALRRAGELHAFAGDNAAADRLLREAVEQAERLGGAHGLPTIWPRLALARLLAWTGRAEAARPLADRALADALHPAPGEEPYQPLEVRRQVFDIYQAQGDLAASRTLIADAFAGIDEPQPDSFELADLLIERAFVAWQSGDLADARRSIEKAEAMANRIGLGPRTRLRLNLRLADARVRLAAGDLAGARAQLAAPAVLAWSDERRFELVELQAGIDVAEGLRAKAAHDLRHTLGQLEAMPRREDWVHEEAALAALLGRLEQQAEGCATALPLLARSAALLRDIHVATSPRRRQAEAAYADCLPRVVRLADSRRH